MKTRVLRTTGAERQGSISTAARLLRTGHLVVFPTETVYGLGASIYHPRAIRRIFKVKGRPADNPLIVHIWSVDQVHLLVHSIPLMFWVLAGRFMPGPLTIVLRKSPALADVVTTGLPTVALRIPDHPIARALLREAGVPVVAPSANLSGRPSPTKAAHVLEDLGGLVDAVLDGGPSRIGVESTVLDLTSSPPVVLRPGGVVQEQIERVLGIKIRVARPTRRGPRSPGMKYRHYSPRAEVVLVEGALADILHAMKRMQRRFHQTQRKVGVLAVARAAKRFSGSLFYSLGPGDAAVAARRLFDGLRTLDRQRAEIILCQGFEEKDIGSALMNRLRKAASRRIRV